jgi:hypothetical protein
MGEYKNSKVLANISGTESGYLDGVTAGTLTASKAVVVGATGKIDTIDITALKLNGTACDEAFLAGASKAALVAANAGVAATCTTTPAVTVSRADSTTLTTVIALANELKARVNTVIAENVVLKASIADLITENATFKTSINAILTALKNAGLQASS